MNLMPMTAKTVETIPESAVLLVAHGSRVPDSNAEIECLVGRLAGRLGDERTVSHAFLELVPPSIPQAIDALASNGAKRIVVIPYFLSAGRHVAEDIPALVEAARDRHPGLSIEITEHFGAQDQVAEILSTMAVEIPKIETSR